MSHLKTLVSFVFVVHCVVLTTLANVISQQQQTNLSSSSSSSSSSLPGLSERATGLNSRYLSASSTASLAAATVAAANQSPSSSSQQQPPTSSSSNNNNNLPTNNNQIALAHQQAIQSSHHQAQQHQQQQQSQVNLQQSVGSNTPSGQPQQYTNIPVTPQQQLFAPQTPVMSTTYTYNPLVSQFQATDFAASNPNSQAQYFQSSQAQNPFGFPPNSYGILPGQLQQQTPFVQNRPVQRFHQQQHHRHPSTSFSRRNGLSRLPQQQQQQQQQQPFQLATIDDDSNGLFQQQQVLSNNNNYGSLNLDQFNLHESGGVNYVLNQHGQQQQQHEQQINPSHLQPGGVIFPSPSTTFGPAFGAANGQASSSSSWSSSDQCVAADGRHGTCYQASECIKRGGIPMGKCGATSGGSQPGGSSNNFQVSSAANTGGQSDQFGGSSHVCCLFDITCGQFAAERFVYFRNPNYPATFDQSRMCRAKIGKLDKGVCQFRLDLLRFDVAKPTNGNCSSDMFVVSGQNENYVIPKICGFNDGQHYYVGVDESGVITLHMMMMGLSYRRSFEILITQIPCRSDYAAPAHCLQYFMGTHGTIKSFNYDNEDATGAVDLGLSNQLTNYDLQQDGSSLALANNAGGPPYGLSFNPNQQQQHLQQRQNLQSGLIGAGRNNANYNDQFGGYPNDLDYTICIRKESGFCSITYQLSRTELGLSPFGVGQFGLSNGDNAGWHQQQVSTECRDDYLLVGGVRLCSGSGGAGGPFSQLGQEGQQIYGLANQTTNPQQLLQLQNQQNLLMQQLTRLQQQQQGATNLNGTTNLAGQSNNGNPLGQQQQQQTGNNINSANNLDQQQAAIVQQLLLIQQQMSVASGNNNNRNYNQFDLSNSGHQQPFGGSNELNLAQNNNNLQGTIITDTTSGPFLLRFVSNMARNARGFHIDYRQNPCK